jgi:hypothetical protein
VNTDYVRLAAVSKLATDEYQQEVQGLNLGEHILQSKLPNRLHDTHDSNNV